MESLRIDHDHLAGLNLALIFRIHEIEGRGLAGKDPRIIEAPQGQRPEAPRIPGGDHEILRQDEQREGALGLLKGLHHGIFQGGGLGAVDEGKDDLGIRGTAEDLALGNEPGPDHFGIGEVAVVTERHLAEAPPHQEGVRRAGHVAAGGGIAGVPDGRIALEAIQHGLGENIRHIAQTLVENQLASVPGTDAGGLLAPVLEGVEAQVGLAAGFWLVKDPEDPALIPERHRTSKGPL